MNAVCAILSRPVRWLPLLFSILLLSPHELAAQGHPQSYRKDRLIIMPKEGSVSSGLRRMHARAGRRVLRAFERLGDLQVVQLAPGEKLEEAAREYLSSGLIAFAEPDYKLHASAAPNDPEFVGGTQWSLRNASSPGHDINAVAGWATLSSASNVVVAIVDSGIRATHEDLAANLWTNPKEIADNGIDDDGDGLIDDVHGINAIDNNGDISDGAGHGTHVAGIIGASANNGIGIAGVAWRVQLMACKFLDGNGDGETSDAIRCIDYARGHGAQIINASWGGTDYSAALYNAIASARAAGIIFVTAAGNDSLNIDTLPEYPACYDLDNIVVVGGTTRSDTLDPTYSNYGAVNVDLFAPGSGIYSTWNSSDSSYTYLSGTSMAAPHVSGVLALMKARFSMLSSSELVARLLATVDVLPSLSGKCKTSGRVNLGRALGSDPTANFTGSKLRGEPPLSVSFTNLTLGATRSLAWDFGDGTPVVTNSNPTHVFAGSGRFDVKLTVIGTNNRTNSFDQFVQVNANYQIVPEDYAWIDPTGMTSIGLADNGVSDPQLLPFAFEFYGQNYGAIYVGANGVLGFDPSGMETTSNTSLPSSLLPHAIICPYWDNLDPAAGGSIYAGTVGDAPDRKFVVSWVGVLRNSTPVPLTFQAILEEESHEIVFQYLETQATTLRGGAKRATVGVEDPTGTTAALYTYNGSPNVISNKTALRIKGKEYRYLVVNNAPVLHTAVGYPVTNAMTALQISNPGTLALDWAVSAAAPWLQLSVTNGTVPASGAAAISLSLTANAEGLPLGTYSTVVTVKNTTDGKGNSSVPVILQVEEPKSVLVIAHADTLNFSGGLGGPFNPGSLVLELQNNGNIPLEWGGAAGASWVALTPSSGRILPAQTMEVQVSTGTSAATLPSGTNSTTISLENETSPMAPLTIPAQVVVRTRVEEASASIAAGVFSGTLMVPAGQDYQIEFSDDLQNWIPLDTITTLSGYTLKFQDFLDGSDRRFYRVRVTP